MLPFVYVAFWNSFFRFTTRFVGYCFRASTYGILSEKILKQNVGTELSNKFVLPSLVYTYVGKYYTNYLKHIKIHIFSFLMKDIFIEI